MKFIELTRTDCNKKLMINFDYVESFSQPVDRSYGACIYLTGCKYPYEVEESYLYIKQLLNS